MFWYAQEQTRKAELYVLREQVGIIYGGGEGGGGPPDNFFLTDGGRDLPRDAIGPKALRWSFVPLFISRRSIATCDFPGGWGPDPLSPVPLDPHMCSFDRC